MFEYFFGRPNDLEYLVSMLPDPCDLIDPERNVFCYSALGAALRQCGKSLVPDFPPMVPARLAMNQLPTVMERADLTGKWELVIRRLIRRGFGVHAPIRRGSMLSEAAQVTRPLLPELMTPLDELFYNVCNTHTVSEVAEARLQILLTEGYNVVTYLEKEQELHRSQPPLTIPHFDWHAKSRPDRKLVVGFETNPKVYLEWHIDPYISAPLVRQEFRHMNIMDNIEDFSVDEWQEVGPISCPTWSDHFEYSFDEGEVGDNIATWQRIRRVAAERYERRSKKKAAKTVRRTGRSARSDMPGSWAWN